MEVLEKPISNEALIDTVEDTANFNELKKFDLNVDAFKRGGFSHEQLRDVADILKNVKSQFIFPFLSCNILYIFNQFNDAVLTFGS